MEIFRPKNIKYLANRYGEICPAAEKEGAPESVTAMIETAITVIADRCYPISGMGVETAHIVVMDSPFANEGITNATTSGILVEFELDDGVKPSPQLEAAMTGLSAMGGDKVAYVIFGGGESVEVETFYDRYVVGVFIEMDAAMKEGHPLVQRHADRLGSLVY